MVGQSVGKNFKFLIQPLRVISLLLRLHYATHTNYMTLSWLCSATWCQQYSLTPNAAAPHSHPMHPHTLSNRIFMFATPAHSPEKYAQQ